MSWIDLPDLLSAPSTDRLVAHGPELDHAAFTAQSLRVAGSLKAASAKRVGLWFRDAAQLGIALLACWRAEAIAVLPGELQPNTVAVLDADVDLWLSDAPHSLLPPAKTRLLADLAGHAPLATSALDAGVSGVEICTSGSSGHPKRIFKRWAQLRDEVRALEHQWKATANPACVMGSVSPQHMYGLPFRVLWPLCAGRPIVRAQLSFPEDLHAATLLHRPAIWVTSPALLRRLSDTIEWTQLAPGLIQVFSSGGPLPADLARTLQARLGCLPTEIYGSSETGAVAWRQGQTDWQALPGLSARAAPDGALHARAPWIDAADEHTADAVKLQDGRFALLGRLDRIVKIEEKRVALPMLEQALAEHDCVSEARVGRAPGAPRLTALVALNETGRHQLRNGGRTALAGNLKKHLAQRFEPLAVPRSWRFVDALPWNAQNKLPQSVFDQTAGPRPTAPIMAQAYATGATDRRYALTIPLDLAHFPGHFAPTPVVPGVALIGWAMTLATRDLLPALRFGGMEALKFQRLTRPGDTVDLAMRWDAQRGKVYFEYTLDGSPCASGRIVAASS